MNLFLTGEIGVGKSHIIDRVLEMSGVSAGGFRTLFFSDRQNPERTLFMMDMYREIAVPAALFSADGVSVRDTCFNEFGVSLLREAGDGRLLVMDELGRFESRAELFRREVFSALSGEIPVLGVLRMSYGGWLNEIRARDDVEIITVTRENRETLPELVIKKLGL